MDCASCQTRIDGLCEGCTSEVLGVIASYRSGDCLVKVGQDVFGQSEPCDAIYNLVEGWIFLYDLLEDGRRQILHFALPSAVSSLHPAHGSLTTFGAQALTDAVVCVIPQAALHSLSKDYPQIGLRLASLTSRDRSIAFSHLTSIGRRPGRERVAHLLLELFIRRRAHWPGQRVEEMHLPLTQDHVGDATGLTGVHVSRVLRELRDEGVVEFHYRRLRIMDPHKLVDIAGIDPQLAMSWVRWNSHE